VVFHPEGSVARREDKARGLQASTQGIFAPASDGPRNYTFPTACKSIAGGKRVSARYQVRGAASVLIAWSSKILVAAIEPSTRQLGLSNAFVGVFVVAILGNAAEHATAITMAMKNRMDLSLAIAIGSSVQVALFVAPVLALASLFVGPAAMDLDFPPGLVLVVLLSVLITGQVAGDGRSDWFKGVQLLAVYLILGMAFAFLAGGSPH